MIEAGGDWRSVLGGAHAFLVWLPPGLLAAVLLAEFIAFVQRDDGSRLARTALWILTALAAVAAGLTGLLHDGGLAAEFAGTLPDDRHRRFGLLLMGGLVLVAAIEVAAPRRARAVATAARVTGVGAGATLLVLAGLSGLLASRGADPVAANLPAFARPMLERLTPPVAPAVTDAASKPVAPVVPTPPEPPRRTWVLRSDLDAEGFAELHRHAATIRTLVVRGLPDDPMLRAWLPELPAVRVVHLDPRDAPLGDVALDFVTERTPFVRDLLLHGTSVTDASLPRLRRLTRLERVSIWATPMEQAGHDALIRGWDAPPRVIMWPGDDLLP